MAEVVKIYRLIEYLSDEPEWGESTLGVYSNEELAKEGAERWRQSYNRNDDHEHKWSPIDWTLDEDALWWADAACVDHGPACYFARMYSFQIAPMTLDQDDWGQREP